MSKHTPGPWEVREHKGRTLKTESHIGIHSPQNATVALMVIGGFFTKADARLIAAAPDLLEALAVVFECERTGQVWPNGHFDRVWDALEKAGADTPPRESRYPGPTADQIARNRRGK